MTETQEPQHDPSLEKVLSSDRARSPEPDGQGDAPKAFNRKARLDAHSTGEHPALRSTSTDNESVKPIGEADEKISQPLSRQEPEDKTPDQQDRNK